TIPSVIPTDLVAAGFTVYNMVTYRLAPPNKLPGQVTDGRYPDQIDDVTRAAIAAAKDSHCNGTVFVIGGSSGAAHAAVLAARNLVKAAVLLSPPMKFDDATSLQNTQFSNAVTNYSPDLPAGSPYYMLAATEAPIFLAAFHNDTMPAPQFTLTKAK